MTEADWETFDSCGCPLTIYAVDEHHIVLDWRLSDSRFEVSRDGQDHVWTPVNGGEARRVRLTPDGALRIAPSPGRPDWSAAGRHTRCPAAPDHQARRSALVADPDMNVRSRCRG